MSMASNICRMDKLNRVKYIPVVLSANLFQTRVDLSNPHQMRANEK